MTRLRQIQMVHPGGRHLNHDLTRMGFRLSEVAECGEAQLNEHGSLDELITPITRGRGRG
jgi:hypothetical protein